MRYPTLRYIFDRRRKTTPKTAGTIDVEICFQNKRKWISTGVSVLRNQWDDSKLIVRHPDRDALILRLESIRRPIEDYINSLMVKGQPFTFEGMKAHLDRKSNNNSFIEFIETRIEEQTDIKPATKKAHRKLVSALKRFGKINSFDSLTRSAILEYDQWLHNQQRAQTTIHTYHKLLKRYINEALLHELIQNDPYLGMRIEKGKSKIRKFLTEEEVLQIRSCSGLLPTLERVRDAFIFQCYTGLAYADLASFDFSNVIKRNGKYIILDQRKKNDEDYYIVLLTPAIEILKKYDFKLPIISNQQYNLRLKLVADAVGINKPLSTHMARHTFLTLALNKGIPIEVVAKMAGHTNIQTTQEYAKLLNATVESAFDELERKLL